MAEGGKIPTILVADDELLREGLEQLADSLGLVTMDRAKSVAELATKPIVPAAVELILILEQPLDRAAYFRDIGEIQRQCPGARLIVFVDRVDAEIVCRAMDLGVHGLLSRKISGQKLKYAIQLVMLDERLFPGVAALQALRELPDTPQERDAGGSFLTKREEEILRLLKAGCPNKLIANSLSTSEATVKVQVRRLFMKIGARNRTQAAIWSLNHLTDTASPRPMEIAAQRRNGRDTLPGAGLKS